MGYRIRENFSNAYLFLYNLFFLLINLFCDRCCIYLLVLSKQVTIVQKRDVLKTQKFYFEANAFIFISRTEQYL